MSSLLFIDSDILFNLLAINIKKKERYRIEGTTGDQKLDQILDTIMEQSKKYEKICISNFSILELVCTLNRLKSEFKISKILIKLFETYDILKINENIIYLAWFIGSKYKMHSGDAIHISFCLINKISSMLIKDDELYDSILLIINDKKGNGNKSIKNFFNNLSLSEDKYKRYHSFLSKDFFRCLNKD